LRNKLINLLSFFLVVLLSISYAKAVRGELKALVPEKLYVGEEAIVQVIAYNPSTGEGLSSVPISMSLLVNGKPIIKRKARTNSSGLAVFKFKVPETEEIKLVLSWGDQHLIWKIPVEKPYTLILTTDKPLYQPGQILHIRVLALNSLTRVPVPQLRIKITVTDPKGNKILIRDLKTDKYGISSTSLNISPDVLLGTYNITAEIPSSHISIQKTVQMKKYQLPKFKIEVILPKTYYKPGEEIKGQLKVHYFFGKPVKGKANISLETYEINFQNIGRTTCDSSFGCGGLSSGLYFIPRPPPISICFRCIPSFFSLKTSSTVFSTASLYGETSIICEPIWQWIPTIFKFFFPAAFL